jgi:hypothetical protein
MQGREENRHQHDHYERGDKDQEELTHDSTIAPASPWSSPCGPVPVVQSPRRYRGGGRGLASPGLR